MANSRNKILFLAFHFPPDAAVGALRPQKFAKHLRELGWEPKVLTINVEHIEMLDAQRLDDVKGIDIFRTPVLRSPLEVGIRIRNALFRRTQKGAADVGGPAEIDDDTDGGFASKVRKLIISLHLLPDERFMWIFTALMAGYKLIKNEKIEIIYATSPPQTCNLLGALLAKLTGAKLVTELRDPWTQLADRRPRHIISDAVINADRRIEEFVMTHSNKIVTTTERYTAALMNLYPFLSQDRVHTICNGYDQSDFDRAGLFPATKDPGTFTISYVGTIYRDRTPEVLLKCITRLIQEGIFPRDGIEVRLVGIVASVGGEPVEQLVERCGSQEYVSVLPPVSHHEAIRLMMNSDVLLLLAQNYPLQVPAKTYEYLAIKKPILALLDDGATRDLITKLNAGITVDQYDAHGITAALTTLYRDYCSGFRRFNTVDVTQYERKHLALEFIKVLEAL